MNWIDKVNNIINKQSFDIEVVGDKVYNELDIVLSLIQTNANLENLSLEVKNYVSLLSNTLEKIALLSKEIALIKDSFDPTRTIYIKNKPLYYNYRLDSYLDESDVRKLEEAHRRCLNLFKQFVRKIIYLVVTGQEISQPQQPVQPVQPPIQQPTFQLPNFLNKFGPTNTSNQGGAQNVNQTQ